MKIDRELLQKKWLSLTATINALEPKNRLILLSLSLFVVFALMYLFAILPIKQSNLTVQKQILELQNQLTPLATNIALLNQQHLAYEQQKKQIEAQLNANDSLFKLLTAAPEFSVDEFIRLAVHLSQQQKRLTIASLKQQPTTTIFANALGKTKNITIYQHNFDLVLIGDYFSLLNYLEQLNQQAWPLVLSNFQFKTMQYPLLQINMQCSVLTMVRS